MKQSGNNGVGQGLDWIDRAICGYLLLPILLFCLWFAPLMAIGLIALTGFGAYRVLGAAGSRPPAIPRSLLLAIAIMSLAWTAVAGVGHFFYSNADWFVRDAVLHDLSGFGWPPSYAGAGTTLILRAPVGYYLPAAGIGQLAGFGSANTALYLWTALGWGLTLAAASSLFETRPQRLLCLLIMTFFGGMDLLGYVWGERHLPAIGEHIEWWMPFVQYSSNTTLLFWVPNHAIPAWLPTILILRHWRRPELARMAPLLATAIPLWSPLAAIGLFPFFLFGLAWRRDFKVLFSPFTSLPFAPAAVVAMLYLSMDATTVQHGWFLDPSSPYLAAFAYRYALFCLLEFGILSLVLARLVPFDTPMRVAIVVLCMLPFGFYGPGNDLAMRASIPALTVLALATVKPLAQARRSIWHVLLVPIVAIGMLGAAQEPLRALAQPRWKPAAQTVPAAVAASNEGNANHFPPHYFARANAHPIHRLMRESLMITGTGGKQ